MTNTDPGPKEGYGLMALESTGACIPPPSSLDAAGVTTLGTTGTSSSTSPMSLAQAPISMLSSISTEEMRQAQRMREAAKDKVKNVRGGIQPPRPTRSTAGP